MLNRFLNEHIHGCSVDEAQAVVMSKLSQMEREFSELTALAEYFGLSSRVLQIAFCWRGEDELILLNVEEMRQYVEQAGHTIFGIEAVRNFIEERGKGDGRLATAIRMLMESADPNVERFHHAETAT